MRKISVVVPTNREDSIKRFLKEWNNSFFENDIIVHVVEDNPQKEFKLNENSFDFQLNHYYWKDIEFDLEKKSCIIPRNSGAIRSYGIFKAFQDESEIILTLDDDCYPLPNYKKDVNEYNYFSTIENNLFTRSYKEKAWENTSNSIKVKGFPNKEIERKIPQEKIAINHGLWANIPDLAGKTQAEIGNNLDFNNYFKEFIVPKNNFFPMCGMNLAWKRKFTPLMYFLLMGKNSNGDSWGYNRFGDNWSGLFIKKVCDHLDYRIYSGNPVVWHDRVSRVNSNIKEEKTSMKKLDALWKEVDNIDLKSKNIKDSYIELAEKINLSDDYFDKLKKSMIVWVNLFN